MARIYGMNTECAHSAEGGDAMITIREAVPKDNDALVDLLRRCPQGTNLVVRLDRAPDFFARSKPYQQFKTFVADDDGYIVGAGECSLRPILKDGLEERAAYGYSYAVDSEYRGHRLALKLEEACTGFALKEGADRVFGWILEDNTPSLKAFGRVGYDTEKMLKVYVFLPFRPQPIPDGVRSMEDSDLEQVTDLLNRTYAGYDYYFPFTSHRLLEFIQRLPGFEREHFYVYEKDGMILSCMGCWDYSRVINGTIIQLSSQLNLVARLMGFLRLFGRVPRVPEMGKNWAYCVPELPGYRNSPDDLIPLWRQLNNFALKQRVNVIMFPLDPQSELVKLTRQGLHVSVGLHQVMRPLSEKASPSTRLIYADPIDI